MPTIKKATIKSYSAATHKATVQIAGSLGVWLDAIRVATDIPAADVVAGRQCTVLFLDPANQDDAVVLTIQGALPSGGGGGTSDHALLTNLAYATAGHTGFETPTGAQTKVDTHAGLADPHTVYGALAQAETWAALQTFSAGIKLAASQTIKDSGGTGRILLATASPHLTLTGRAQFENEVSIGDAGPIANRMLTISPTLGPVSSWTGININPNITLNSAGNITAILGNAAAVLPAGGVNLTLAGLDFLLVASVSGGTASALVARANLSRLFLQAQQPTDILNITRASNYETDFPNFFAGLGIWGTVNITDFAHLYAPAFALSNASVVITNTYGLYIGNISGTSLGNPRLLELRGATGPNLRVEGGGDPTNPGASKGRSRVLMDFNENGTVTLRRVEWIDSGAAGGAAIPANTKVLVAV